MTTKKSKRLFCLLLIFSMLISVLPSYAGDDTSEASIPSTIASVSEENDSGTEEGSATQETPSETTQENIQIEETITTSPSEGGSESLPQESSPKNITLEGTSESASSESLSGTQGDDPGSEDSSEGNTTYTNSISGIIWLDDNEDGVYDSGENPVEDYEVSLYLTTDTDNAIATATTDLNGEFVFNNITPGDYRVGVPIFQTVNNTEYLVPLVGISGDNKFDLDTTYNAYTDIITVVENTIETNYNAGVRLRPNMQPMANTVYYINMNTGAVTNASGITVSLPTGVTINSSLLTFASGTDSTDTFILIDTAADARRVVIDSGVTVNITLNNCSITHSGYSPIINNGTLNLTLTGNNTTKMSGEGQTTSYYTAGIYVDSTATLTITSTSTGSLSASGGSYVNSSTYYGGAGIGGSYSVGATSGTININGGTITAAGGGSASINTVYGGAGIGGGGSYGGGGNINISGSSTQVTATGGGTASSSFGSYGGAGIGGGAYYGAGGNINISGGTVSATGSGTGNGGYGGAGIGGGSQGSSGTINISGGTVSATGGGTGNGSGSSVTGSTYGAAGIGSGNSGNVGSIDISNSTVTATGGGTSSSSYTSSYAYGGAGIGGGSTRPGGIINISNSNVIASGGGTSNGGLRPYGGAGIGGGYNAAGGNITINGGTVEANGGGTNIGTSTQGSYGGAGIGGGSQGAGGTISIIDGTITANGGGNGGTNSTGGAGIGGGRSGAGGTINISGGTVTANGGGTGSAIGYGGAGIGGGYQGPGGNTTITGGTVTASGGGAVTNATPTSIFGAPGIGGGGVATGGGNIYLQGGTVTAIAGKIGGTSVNVTFTPYAIGGGGYAYKATVVEISSSVTLTAYSPSSSYPAIGSNSITGDGYVVNGYITNRTSHTAVSSQVITLAATPSGQNISLPADYSGIAYSTGSSSTTENIWVKNTSGTVVGGIVYDPSEAADIQPTQADIAGQVLKFAEIPYPGTLTAENVSKTTADIKSTDYGFMTSATNAGYYYLAADTGFPNNSQIHTWTSTTANPYTWNVTNLKSNTQYYYKSTLTNAYATSISATKSFITLPDVTSSGASITNTAAAALSCAIADEGANTASINSIKIYISTTNSQPSSPYITLTSGYTATGFSNYDISSYGLSAGQTYYYWIQVSNETTYGGDTIGGSTTVDGSFVMPYTVTEKYVDKNGSQIQPDTSRVIPGTVYYQYSGSLGNIVTLGCYYTYLGYTVGSYTAGQVLNTGTPEVTILSGDVTVYIVYEDLNTLINVTVPGSFYWYADQTTETSSGSGTYEIESDSYNIINNSDNLNLKVSLDSYASTVSGRTFSSVSESNIQLNLTGDLTEGSIGQDLFNGAASRFGTYTNILYGNNYMLGSPSAGDKRIWTFGFDGRYTGALPTTGNEIADYTVMLTFSVTSTTP